MDHFIRPVITFSYAPPTYCLLCSASFEANASEKRRRRVAASERTAEEKSSAQRSKAIEINGGSTKVKTGQQDEAK